MTEFLASSYRGELMTIEERDARLTTLEHDLGRLIRIIDGEEGVGPGVVGILRRHEDHQKSNTYRLEAIEMTISRVKWTFAGAAAAGGLFGGGLVFLITQLVEGNLPT